MNARKGWQVSQAEFREYMEILFHDLEISAGYYWQYQRQLKIFEMVNRLAYDSGLLKKSVFEKSQEFIRGELNRYV